MRCAQKVFSNFDLDLSFQSFKNREK